MPRSSSRPARCRPGSAWSTWPSAWPPTPGCGAGPRRARRTGFLIGSRRIDVRTSSFRVGQTLTVVATHTWGEQEAAAFACTLRDADSGTILVEGTLSVYRPRTLDGLPRRRPGMKRVLVIRSQSRIGSPSHWRPGLRRLTP